MIAAAQIGALNGSQKVAERAGEIARPHVPGPEARMDIAHGVAQDIRGHLAVDFVRRRRRLGQSGVE
ncbi:hypothetical protein D3C71_2140680 [compost metagenome]